MCVCVCVGTGVTVNCVHPGVASTELGRHTGLHQSPFSTTVLSKYICPYTPHLYIYLQTSHHADYIPHLSIPVIYLSKYSSSILTSSVLGMLLQKSNVLFITCNCHF